ncbi:MAG: hypothetical protein JWO12_569 [Frankiales bacterium]|nr:hypothetical protein [Frankiales bacterium]
MCWMCEHPDKSYADYVEEIVVPTIALSGWAVQGGRALTYTIGLTEVGQPELAVTGKPPDEAYDLIEAVLAGESQPRAGTRCDLLLGPALRVVQVAHARRLRVARTLYGDRVSALQLVWADSLGRWPWEAGPAQRQELLGAVDLRRAG